MLRIRVFVWIACATTLVAVACRQPAGPEKPKPKAKSEQTTQPIAAATISPAAETAGTSNPLAPYMRRSIADEFNPDVTEAERRQPRPQRGGTLVVRMSGDISTVNPLLQTWQQDQMVLSYIAEYPESFLRRDAETLEYTPKMAEYWRIRDLIQTRDGKRIEGLVTSETAQSVVLAPGASLWTLFRSDIVSSDTKTGRRPRPSESMHVV